MDPLHMFAAQLPRHSESIPGVWPRKGGLPGGRIPLNAAPGLGLINAESLRVFDRKRLRKILRSPAFYSWVENMLMEHQWEILEKSINRRGFHAWAPPGSGKTLCGLVWIAAAVRSPKVVITKAAARGTWREEIRKYTRFTPVVLSGMKPSERIMNSPRYIYITAWETLMHWEKALVDLGPHSLVMDEIHWAKNPKRVKPVVARDGSTRFDPLPNTASAISRIVKKSERRLGLTATPIPNRTKDLWAQLDLVEPWCWGTFHKFGERYCAGYKDLYGWKYDGLSNEDELMERLEWCRHKTDQKAIAQNLPQKRRQVVYLGREEQNAPGGFKRDIRSAKDHTSLFEVMLQEAASRKRKYVLERVSEAVRFKQKVVVFTGRRADCDRLGKDIAKKVACPVFCAHGGTTTEARDKIRHEYMAAETAVLVGTGDAWGESVNLQDTDLALFVMLPWTPKSIRQWEGRFARLGQKRPVLISYVIARGTVDEHVADILLEKLPPVGVVAEDETMDEIDQAFKESDEDLLDRVANVVSLYESV